MVPVLVPAPYVFKEYLRNLLLDNVNLKVLKIIKYIILYLLAVPEP